MFNGFTTKTTELVYKRHINGIKKLEGLYLPMHYQPSKKLDPGSCIKLPNSIQTFPSRIKDIFVDKKECIAAEILLLFDSRNQTQPNFEVESTCPKLHTGAFYLAPKTYFRLSLSHLSFMFEKVGFKAPRVIHKRSCIRI